MFHQERMKFVAFAAAALFCVGASQKLAAQSAPNVLYTAKGTFSANPVSGNDLLHLAGTPFIINLLIGENTKPAKSGKGWAEYDNVDMAGGVDPSRNPQAVPIKSNKAILFLSQTNSGYDELRFGFPIVVDGFALTVTSTIHMPKGTLSTVAVKPFTASVALNASDTRVQYADSTAATKLAVAAGSMNAVTH